MEYGGNYIKQDNVEVAVEFWQRQRPPKAEEVKSTSEQPHPHVREFKKLSVLPSHTGLNHTNVLSYVDVIRQDVNVGNMVAIIGAGRIWFDAKRWMEDWGLDGTNEARAGAAAAFPSQRRIWRW